MDAFFLAMAAVIVLLVFSIGGLVLDWILGRDPDLEAPWDPAEPRPNRLRQDPVRGQWVERGPR